MNTKQEQLCNEVAAEVSILLAEWMREKFDQGMTIDEVAGMIHKTHEMIQDAVR